MTLIPPEDGPEYIPLIIVWIKNGTYLGTPEDDRPGKSPSDLLLISITIPEPTKAHARIKFQVSNLRKTKDATPCLIQLGQLLSRGTNSHHVWTNRYLITKHK